jgi:hypothetical protein
MKSSVVLQGLAALCIAAAGSPVFAQNSVQLFGPVTVRYSTSGTNPQNPNVFNSANLNLSCATSPIVAKLSSSSDGTANVLVDNFITLSVGGSTAVDICSGGNQDNNLQNCATDTYKDGAVSGSLNGEDPDPFVGTWGVPPLDISGSLAPGANQATIAMVDEGGQLASSSLYLVTNCTPSGVAGPGNVTGNPISSGNPGSLTQTFSFNPYSGQQVQFTYDLSEAQTSGQLTITDGTIPSVSDTPLSPVDFQKTYLHDTSFATATCLVHTGETYNGSPGCKLFTLTCQVGVSSDQSGIFCPTSQSPNEIFKDDFDGPSFTLPDVAGTHGGMFHQGVAFLEAKDKWTGGTCMFDPASDIASELCPQNLLTNFSGPGAYEGSGRGQSSNSTFVTVAPVPEDLTTVTVKGQRSGYWIKSHTASIKFVSKPPAVASSNNFVAAPIQSITYGISPASNVPQPGPPVLDDMTLDNSGCPAPGQTDPPAATPFKPSAETVSVAADGYYQLHYYAQDCAGTKELKFTETAGSWSNVDTVKPEIFSKPTLSPSATTYAVGQTVIATYGCKDALSGVVQCGTYVYDPGAKLDTGQITSTVDTSEAGPHTFTVNAVDAAGNMSKASVDYQVGP